ARSDRASPRQSAGIHGPTENRQSDSRMPKTMWLHPAARTSIEALQRTPSTAGPKTHPSGHGSSHLASGSGGTGSAAGSPWATTSDVEAPLNFLPADESRMERKF